MFRINSKENTLYSAEVRHMKSWIAKCVKDHKDCTPVIPGDFLPTRLLDVRGPAIRLIDSKCLNVAVDSYAALSYCWGTTMLETGKTTRESEGARRKAIDYALLPRTLREAIRVTQALGIPYLWIDALCIIQGDAEDWLKESATMCEVYSNARVTIAAGTADHCDGGFIQPKPNVFKKLWGMSQFNHSMPSPDSSQSYETRQQERKRQKHITNTAIISQSSLSTRGWTLQERHLSTRNIQFTTTYIVWECRVRNSSYRVVERHSPSARDDSAVLLDYARCFDRPLGYKLTRSIAYLQWNQMVKEYSQKDFTNPEDKLVAISGLAKAMQPLIKSECLAGHWINYLQQDLLWRRATTRTSHAAYTCYYAPSWSWISTNFEIDIYDHDMRGSIPPANDEEFVVEVSVHSTGGRLLPGGFLRLRTFTRSLGAPGESQMTLIFDDDGISVKKSDLLRSPKDYSICSIQVISPYAVFEEDSDEGECIGLILQSTGGDQNGVQEYKRAGIAHGIEQQSWMERGTFEEIILV